MGGFDLNRYILFVVLRDHEVQDILADSDIGDFLPSDEDVGDPQYSPPSAVEQDTYSSDSDNEGSEDNSVQARPKRGMMQSAITIKHTLSVQHAIWVCVLPS